MKQKMENTKIMIEFSAYGENINLSEITKKMQMNPDVSWEKGERIRDTKALRKETCWMLSTGYQESLDINNQLSELLEKLRPKEIILKELLRDYAVEYKFDIAIKIERKQTPAIYLESETLAFSNSIKAKFDFDLYIIS